jgi:O-antigen/teichoic acid export membrane protein
MSPLNTVPETSASTAQESRKFRSQMGQISRHSAVFFAGTMFTAAAGYLFKVYLARVLGAEALGVYALGMTIIGFIGVFNGLGLPQSAVRFVAAYSATGRYDELRGFIVRAVGALLAANVLLGLLVVVAGPWIAEHFYHTPQLKAYLGLFALIMMLGALTTFFGQVLQGYKDVSRRTIITNFIGTPLMMVLTVALVWMGRGLWGYIFAQVASAVAVLLLLLITVWNLTPPGARRLVRSLGRMESQVISFGATVFGISLMEFLLSQVDKVLIGFYIDAQEVGIYAVAMAIVAFIPVALQSVNQIFSPTIADLHARGEVVILGRLFQTLTKWILAFTLPLATVVIVFSRPLMRIFGPAFEAGSLVLVLGTAGQLINCGTGSVGYLLLMSGNQKRLLKVQAVMTCGMVLLNALLIPAMGIVGAAVATGVTAVMSNLWYLREVRAALGISPYNRRYWRLLPAVTVSVTLVLGLRIVLAPMHLQWLAIAISAALGYSALFAVAAAVGLDEDDRVLVSAVRSRLHAGFGNSTVTAE